MGLLSPADQDKVREALAEMTRKVRLLFFTQAIDCETCLSTREILDELPPLSDKISLEEINFVLEGDRAKQYGIDRVPGVALLYDEDGALTDSRIRFLGAPSGYEFLSLVQAVMLAGGRHSNLSDGSRQRIAGVNKPITMQVFTTPT
jgi:alkyl hydroperoxide reductase subunit AhpF